MSVRDGMLAILTLGPAYGSQLHSELTSRTPHRSPVNVGQIYTTIDRLGAQKLIAAAGTTDDGLPLHALTEAGHHRATEWMSRANPGPTLDWTEMLDQVLIVATVDTDAARELVNDYTRLWRGQADGHPSGEGAGLLAHAARRQLALAATTWLAGVTEALRDDALTRPLDAERPRRGRPSVTPAP